MAGKLHKRLCLVLAIVLALAGCTISGYRTFTMKKGIAHFSFEYPAGYRITRLEVRDDEEYRYTDVGLLLRVSGGERIPTVIDVFVDDSSSHYPNSNALLEERLALFPRMKRNFNILERSSVRGSGVEGQQIVYSWTSPSVEPEVVVTREVYFDTEGLIWHLSLDSSEAQAGVARTDFEHILGTLKVFE